jgi:hypothetical protein
MNKMKKNLLLVVILVLSGIIKLQAQCTVSNLTVDIKNVTSGVGGCQVTLDATFTGNFNNGNKFAFIHLWEKAPVNNYPTIDYNVGPPTAAQLANAVATIVIKDPGDAAALHSVYVPNSSVPVKFSGITFSKTGTTFTLENVVVTLSTCGDPVTVVGDVWASQSNTAQNAHCSNSGLITILFNNPIISGIKQCATPRLLNLSFKNEHATINESVLASVFIDNNNNGDIDGGDIDITSSLSPGLPNPINLAANTTQPFSGLSYLPYSNQGQYDTKPIIVRANATAPGAATVVITKSNINFLGSCALLPVTFSSFTAKRDQSNVVLQWETSSEQNNDGFAVERNINGAWNQLAFIPSQAAGGNSNSRLVYKYDDMNAVKAVSQYRLKQIDIDGQFKYSQIRSVFGEAQAAKVIVYPTPSSNGKVSVVFEETNGTHDISLMDMTGRVIKQWKAVYNNIQIDNLTSGIYHLRIVSRETGIQTVEKVVVSRK